MICFDRPEIERFTRIPTHQFLEIPEGQRFTYWEELDNVVVSARHVFGRVEFYIPTADVREEHGNLFELTMYKVRDFVLGQLHQHQETLTDTKLADFYYNRRISFPDLDPGFLPVRIANWLARYYPYFTFRVVPNNWSRLEMAPFYQKDLSFPNIRRLDFSYCDLIQLEQVPYLGRQFTFVQVLDFTGSELTDGILGKVSGCHALQILLLSKCNITDEGLRSALEHKTEENILYEDEDTEACLTALDLTGCRFLTDACLRGLVSLNTLTLDDCAWVTDETIELINAMPKLKYLGLANTRVTDHGIGRLTNPSLQTLRIGDCSISARAVNELKRVNPNVNVIPNQRPEREDEFDMV